MFSMMLTILLTAQPLNDSPGQSDADRLVKTIESLQRPVEDFQCEFEGKHRFKGKAAEGQKLGEDGLYDSFSGIFIWKKGGDTRSDVLHRRAADGLVARDTLVVRMREQQAEQYYRLNDAPLGYAVIENPKNTNSWVIGSLGSIFLIDKIKRDVIDPNVDPSVSDDHIEGQPLKVLSITLKNFPDTLMHRYWIDLARNGHVIRHESYMRGKIMGARLDIKLATFMIGKAEVWMPVSGNYVGYGAVENHTTIIVKDPTVLKTIGVVNGTMAFNKHPGAEVFTMKYKPGVPISANLRGLESEFSQQKPRARPKPADAQNMLREQLAKVGERPSELAADAPASSSLLISWLPCGFGAIVVVSLIALWIERRRHFG